MDKFIKKNISDTIIETDIEKFEVYMMLCEDVSFRNMDPMKPEEAITDQEDSLTPGQVSEYVGMEVVLPKRDGY